MDSYQNYIDGAWVDGGAGRIDVTDPATGAPSPNTRLPMPPMWTAPCRPPAGASLRRADDMRPIERGRMVQAMGRYLLEHKDEIARVLTLEQGKPLWESVIEVEGAALYFEYYGNQASTVEGRSIPLGAGYFDWTEYEPFGVSAQIIPWNYPVEMTARSLSAALATGNACVIKTPELTPLTNAWFARAAEAAGFCPGAVNVLCGLGRGRRGAAATGRQPDRLHRLRAHRASPSPRRRRRTWCPACWSLAANRRPSCMTTPISTRSRMISAGASTSTRARSVRR
jgi:aldehyde dehydrogenase (NAD+)